MPRRDIERPSFSLSWVPASGYLHRNPASCKMFMQVLTMIVNNENENSETVLLYNSTDQV